MWRPDLPVTDRIWRAHLQLQHWRQDGNAAKICFWYTRRDDLLDDPKLSRRPLEPDLDQRLSVPHRSLVRLLRTEAT